MEPVTANDFRLWLIDMSPFLAVFMLGLHAWAYAYYFLVTRELHQDPILEFGSDNDYVGGTSITYYRVKGSAEWHRVPLEDFVKGLMCSGIVLVPISLLILFTA